MVVAVRVFVEGSAGFAGGGEEGEGEGLGVEAEEGFYEAGAVGEGVVCHWGEEGGESGDEGVDFGRGEGVRDFQGGHVQA